MLGKDDGRACSTDRNGDVTLFQMVRNYVKRFLLNMLVAWFMLVQVPVTAVLLAGTSPKLGVFVHLARLLRCNALRGARTGRVRQSREKLGTTPYMVITAQTLNRPWEMTCISSQQMQV